MYERNVKVSTEKIVSAGCASMKMKQIAALGGDDNHLDVGGAIGLG